MTDTTPHLGIPYAEPSDARGAGANAMRDLANAVDRALWRSESITANPADSPSGAATGGTVVVFAGPILTLFTETAPGSFRFDGTAERMFLVATQVEVATGGSDLATVTSSVEVRVDGVPVASSYDRLDSFSESDNNGTIEARNVVHTPSVPVVLQPGQTVSVVAFANPAGSVGVAALRVYPMGPLGPA